MVRSALADDYLLKYLCRLAGDDACAVGLILGQSCLNKYNVVHFAKTPPFQTEEEKKEGVVYKPLKSISNVNENWVADQARHATRMLPGGLHVLGIFVLSSEDCLTPFNTKIRSILLNINKVLSSSNYLYGNCDNEKLVLQYNPRSQKYYAKTFDVNTTVVQSADFKFLPKANKWSILESRYEIDQLYYLKPDEVDWHLKKHVKIILDSIVENLNKSLVLYDGDIKMADDCLENIGKKRGKVPRGSTTKHQEHTENQKPVQVSIFQECGINAENSYSSEWCQIGGQIRLVGEVACKLFLNPKTTIKEASVAVVQDIIRSLSTRFEMHWDCLTEEEHSEDVNSVHEPPRRVLITLPESNVSLSDYLFPGEGSEDVKLSLEEILDVKTDKNLDIQDIEGAADITQYYNGAVECKNEEILPKMASEKSGNKYCILVIALLILLVAILTPIVYASTVN